VARASTYRRVVNDVNYVDCLLPLANKVENINRWQILVYPSPKVSLPMGDPGFVPIHGTLGSSESTLQTAPRSAGAFLHSSRYDTRCYFNVHSKADISHGTHTHPYNGPFSRTTLESWYQKGKTNLDFTEARDSEWQWHQLGHMQVCTLLQTDNHANIPPLSFYRPDALPAAQPTASKH